MSSRPRALSLHHSALSDDEYESYTASLAEMINDFGEGSGGDRRSNSEWESARLSVREVRGWLRGRYGESVGVSKIDQILSFFHPDKNPLGVLTGGEYFAVLRLVNHARNGNDPAGSLVFTQASPSDRATPPNLPSPPTSSNPFSRPIASSPLPQPISRSPFPSAKTSPDADTIGSDVLSQSSSYSAPGRHETPLRANSITAGADARPTPSTASPSSNPFLTRSKSTSYHTHTHTHTTPSSVSSPPLPPRKVKPLLPPPRHSSQSQAHSPSVGGGGTKSLASVNPLMQQSLKVAKAARGAAAAEKGLAAQRYTQVISRSGASTSSANGHVHGHSDSRSNDGSSGSTEPSEPGSGAKLIKRVPPAVPPKPTIHALVSLGDEDDTVSATSLERIASASTGLRGRNDRATGGTAEDGKSPFDSASSNGGAPGRVRARSLHNTTTSLEIDLTDPLPAPLPPPRRKRPESVQVLSSPTANPSKFSPPGLTHTHSHSNSQGFSMSRSSLSISKTFNAIQSGAEHARESSLALFRADRDREDRNRLVESDEEDDEDEHDGYREAADTMEETGLDGDRDDERKWIEQHRPGGSTNGNGASNKQKLNRSNEALADPFGKNALGMTVGDTNGWRPLR